VTGKLVLENLKHRPMRTLLSVLLIGVPVTLQLTLVGLSHGFLEDSKNRARGIGADVIVRPKESSILGSISGSPLPEALIPYFLKYPHVVMATGVVNQPVNGITLGATGVDLEAFTKMSGGFHYIEGGPFRGPDDVIVDRYYAEEHHLHAGDTVKLLNRNWRLSGIMESGTLTRIAMPIRVLQDLTASHGLSQIYLKLDDPAEARQVVKDLREELHNDQIYAMAEFTSAYNVNNVPALREFIGIVMGIGVVIGFAVVCLSMYMSVLQRTREIGILKSLGASKFFILRLILLEALIMGFGGTVLGIGMSYGAYWLLHVLRPASFPIAIVHEWWIYAGAVTLLGALLGAIYPGTNAASHDPIEALAYE
jgi:putative ABC transport system permease protein